MEMISQRCPKCNSSRIRAGYRPTPLWSKLLFRFNLLCNNCNWEFRGFAVPGTVSSKSKQSKKKHDGIAQKNKQEESTLTDEKTLSADEKFAANGNHNPKNIETVEKNENPNTDSKRTKTKKKVKIRLRA